MGIESHERAGREQGFGLGRQLMKLASPKTFGFFSIFLPRSAGAGSAGSLCHCSPPPMGTCWSEGGTGNDVRENQGQSRALGDPGTRTGRTVARRHPAPLQPWRDRWPSRTEVVDGLQALPVCIIFWPCVPSSLHGPSGLVLGEAEQNATPP